MESDHSSCKPTKAKPSLKRSNAIRTSACWGCWAGAWLRDSVTSKNMCIVSCQHIAVSKISLLYRTVGLFSIVFLCLCKKHPGEFCNAPSVFELYMLYDSMTLVPVVWCLYVLMGKSWHNPKTDIYYMVVNGCPLTIIRESIQWAYQLQFMGHDQPLLRENYQCFDNGSSHPILFHQGWTARGRLLTAANTTNQKKHLAFGIICPYCYNHDTNRTYVYFPCSLSRTLSVTHAEMSWTMIGTRRPMILKMDRN